jgi:hypothetical protein
VHHHCLRPAGHHGVAVRHRYAHVLVRHDHDLGQAPAELLALGVGLDHRREIGAAVGEEVLDAARGEQPEPGVRGGFGLERCRLRFRRRRLRLRRSRGGFRRCRCGFRLWGDRLKRDGTFGIHAERCYAKG